MSREMNREEFLRHKRRLRYIVDRNLFLLTKRANERPFRGKQGLYYFLLSRAGTYTFWGRYYLGEVPHPRWGTYIETPNERLGNRYLSLANELRAYTRRCARFIDLFKRRAMDVRSRDIKTEEQLFRLKEIVYEDKVAERDFVEEIKLNLMFKYRMMKDLINDLDWYVEKIDEQVRKVEDLINEERGVFRLSAMLIFYAREIKKYTPIPFAEFRVWMLTHHPSRHSEKEFVGALMNLMNLFPTVKIAFERGSAYIGDEDGDILASKPEEITARIIGFEREIIDPDEVEENFRKTGLPRSEWKYDTIYRYVCFYKKEPKYRVPKGIVKRLFDKPKEKIHVQYNEARIRSLEGSPVVE